MRLKPRAFRPGDAEQLELWRQEYAPADLTLPHQYDNAAESTETVVIEDENGNIVLSLTGTIVVAFDPLIRDPNAAPEVVAKALQIAEACLVYNATRVGAVDAYIAVPYELEAYHRFLAKRGYVPTAQNCLVLRKQLVEGVPEEEGVATPAAT